MRCWKCSLSVLLIFCIKIEALWRKLNCIPRFLTAGRARWWPGRRAQQRSGQPHVSLLRAAKPHAEDADRCDNAVQVRREFNGERGEKYEATRSTKSAFRRSVGKWITYLIAWQLHRATLGFYQWRKEEREEAVFSGKIDDSMNFRSLWVIRCPTEKSLQESFVCFASSVTGSEEEAAELEGERRPEKI